MNNIEEFNIAAGEIFGVCYREFPKPTPIFKTEIGHAIKDGMGVEHDPGRINLGDHEYKVVDHTLTWLIQAGYIWAEKPDAPASSMNIRLSPLGLEILKSVPDSLQATENLGESLAKGVKALGKEVLFTTVSTALSIGLSSGGA